MKTLLSIGGAKGLQDINRMTSITIHLRVLVIASLRSTSPPLLTESEVGYTV